METWIAGETVEDDILTRDRAHALRLLTALTRDREVAEDLAQETLVEAWRHAHKLHDPAGRTPWLSAIARNVYRHWRRRQGREAAHRAEPGLKGQTGAPRLEDLLLDDGDLAVQLERDELAELLDRALALLPSTTREALVARYVHESSLAEIAARLGTSEKAASMRLSRGKLLLHRALTADLARDAACYGPREDTREDWRETRIWCSVCGQHRLRGILTDQVFSLRCPDCRPKPGVIFLHSDTSAIRAGVHGFKAALNRHMAWSYDHVTTGLRTGAMACPRCGRPCLVRVGLLADAQPGLRDVEGVSYRCAACGFGLVQSLDGLAALHPAGRQFWRRHPRIHTLPAREVEAGGRAALVFGIESVADGARLDLIATRDTFEILGVYGAAHVERDGS